MNIISEEGPSIHMTFKIICQVVGFTTKSSLIWRIYFPFVPEKVVAAKQSSGTETTQLFLSDETCVKL